MLSSLVPGVAKRCSVRERITTRRVKIVRTRPRSRKAVSISRVEVATSSARTHMTTWFKSCSSMATQPRSPSRALSRKIRGRKKRIGRRQTRTWSGRRTVSTRGKPAPISLRVLKCRTMQTKSSALMAQAVAETRQSWSSQHKSSFLAGKRPSVRVSWLYHLSHWKLQKQFMLPSPRIRRKSARQDL